MNFIGWGEPQLHKEMKNVSENGVWLVVFRHPSEKYESIGMMTETQYMGT